MDISGVAALTQHRRAHRQEMGVVRTVGRVTAEAVVADGAVLPEERAALFVVAGEAERVDARRAQHSVSARSMNVVTLAALHASAAVIVRQDVCGTLQLRAPHRRMADVAGLRF